MLLKEYIEKHGFRATFVYDKIGYSRAYISKVIAGKQPPTMRFIKAVEKATRGLVNEKDLNPNKLPLNQGRDEEKRKYLGPNKGKKRIVRQDSDLPK